MKSTEGEEVEAWGASLNSAAPAAKEIAEEEEFTSEICTIFRAGSADAAEMRKVFHRFDENHDGRICQKDLGCFMKRLGFEMTEEEVGSMLQTIDRNSDKSIDFDEFFSLYNTLRDEQTTAEAEIDDAEEEGNLREAFSIFDADKDGYISPRELQQVLLNLGLHEGKSLLKCQRMIERVDVDGNGQVDFKEFKVLMHSDAFQ